MKYLDLKWPIQAVHSLKNVKHSLFFLAMALLCSTNLLAQAPESFSYQAVVRDLSNNLIANTTLGVRITILQASPAGSEVFKETHNPFTNNAGLITIEIGTGAVVTGSITAINWEAGPYFIKQEIDPSNGTNYTISATTQLLSVPYALYSKNSGRASSAATADIADALSSAGSSSLSVPLGTILTYAGPAANVPTGWLLCDGSSYDVNAYPELFSLIGTAYGSEPNRFKVPNFLGRIPAGYDNAQSEFNALGKAGGAKTHQLSIGEMPSHNHNFNDPGHSHGLNTSGNSYRYIFVNGNNTADGGFDNSPTEPNLVTPGPVPVVYSSSTGITVQSQGSNQGHNNLQPYLSVNFIIKAR